MSLEIEQGVHATQALLESSAELKKESHRGGSASDLGQVLSMNRV